MPSRPLSVLDLSLVLKYCLLRRAKQEISGIKPGIADARSGLGFEELNSCIQDIWNKDLEDLLQILKQDHDAELAPEDSERILSETYRQRMTFLVWEQLLGQRSAPELRVCPGILPAAEYRRVFGEKPVVLIVFESFPNIMNECFPLFVDSYVHNLDTFGEPRWQVCASHIAWLDGQCKPTRAAFYDAARHALIETDCDPPPPVRAVLVLCASPAAHRTVSRVAAQSGILQLNPYPGAAETADSKIACYDLWKQAGVPTPRTVLIPTQSSPAIIQSTLERFRESIGRDSLLCSVQPNSGTEGHGVNSLILETERDSEALSMVRRILKDDDAIVREWVGNVRIHYPGDTTGRACDLRLNVSFDGERYHAESGYMQVAGDELSMVSSTSRGGTILKFSRGALERLHGPEGHTIEWDLEMLNRIRGIAESAVQVFPELGLVGVDLKLEIFKSGEMGAQVLDANPRPAGLTHSEFTPQPGKKAEPGVTRRLWRRISDAGT
ncbi:MAG TPA: hypothetical protein PLY86_13915 [bacterium]|nr:hypothetical protein [bacterium]